ncbi:zinc finger protein 69 homolog [Pecten maximus]|uniref:zinc finger protein 69 homolog n=1 Tax=Pecten maximus TaxID=6579 RepID=UPI001457EF42|nr:zinc finger protein 69 homolog [Pecten maximus]
MAEKLTNEHDILQLFKSKVEEAVGMVALIPDAQRRQLHDFWDVISNTINPLSKCDDKTKTAAASNDILKTGDDQSKNDEASNRIQEECDSTVQNKNNETNYSIEEECLPPDNTGQEIQANEHGTTNEDGQLVSSDIQDFLDMVSTSNQITYSGSPVTSTLSGQSLSVTPFSLPEDTPSQFTCTSGQQDVTLEVTAHHNFDNQDVTSNDVSDTEYLDNKNVIEIEAHPGAPTKEGMVSILKKEIAAPTEIMCEVREDSQTIEIHLPPDFAEGEILTPEKLSMLLQGQFQNYSPVKAETSNIHEHQFVDDSVSVNTPLMENVSKLDFKNEVQVFHEQSLATSNKSTKNGYSEVLHEITDNKHPKADSHVVPSYNEPSLCNGKRKRKKLMSSPERSSKRIKQKKDNVLVEGDILTPDKVLDYLYGEEIDKEIDNKELDQDDNNEHAVKTGSRRRRRNIRLKQDISSKSLPPQRSSKRPHAERNKTGNGEFPWECKTCGIKLSNSGALLVHERKHTGVRPFSCKECDKTFTTKQNMKRHELSHTGEKPFTCDLCEKSFTEKKSLIIHKRTHTGRETLCVYDLWQSLHPECHTPYTYDDTHRRQETLM